MLKEHLKLAEKSEYICSAAKPLHGYNEMIPLDLICVALCVSPLEKMWPSQLESNIPHT